MLTSLKIGARLGLGFGLILALLMVVMGVGLNRMGVIGENTKEIVEHYGMQEEHATRMSEQQHIITRLIRTVIIEESLAEKKKYDAKLMEARQTYDSAARELEGTLRSAESKSLFAKVAETKEKVRRGNTRVLDLTLAGRNRDAGQVLIDEVQPLADTLQADIDALSAFLKASTKKRYETALATERQATAFMISISAIALIAGAALALFITRSVTSPLRTMGAVIETVAQGDLTQRVEIDSKDELGELGRTLNRT
ncbi:MAG: MCP four helix bundle domain-containing protein, partial [Acidobacteria bacterium]|nr:MCP four helix bundle domain-containing protein [Acidobacteriota bacterium]